MHVMSEKDFKTFEQFVKMTQPSLKKVMTHWLKQKYTNVVETKDYVYAIGDIPVALAAHMDTVFAKPVSDLFYDTNKNVMWSTEGLGADDRAGVFAIWQIVKSGLKPHIILSTDEESGCLGARELSKLPCPFEDLRYIVQLDRRGVNDCVFYDCDNPEFVKYVEAFGFIEAHGTFTDITKYCPAWGAAGVNLSVGYYNEHSYSEILYVNALYATIEKVKRMLKEEEIPAFQYIEKVYAYDVGAWGKYGWGTGLNKNYVSSYDLDKCDRCHQDEFVEDLFPVKGLDGKTKFFCPSCIIPKYVEWCSICYEAVEKKPDAPYVGKRYICADCQARKEKK